MSVINQYKDPMSGKVNHFAKGSIKFISIKPVKEGPNVVNGVKTTWIKVPGQADKKVESTHVISLLLQEVDDNNNIVDPSSQGEWISVGEKKLHPNHTDKVQINKDGSYVDILPGMVVSMPLKISVKGDRQFVNASLSGKTFNILDSSKAVANAPRQNNTNNSPQASQNAPQQQQTSGDKTTKVYGDVSAVEGFIASVTTSSGEVGVILSEEQAKEVIVGGRLAGYINGEGHMVSGFKVYPPKGTGSKKDTSGTETGHAINGALILRRNGLASIDVVEVAKVVHDITLAIKAKAKGNALYSDMDDYNLGSMVGHAVLNATRDIEVSDTDTAETLNTKITHYVDGLLEHVVSEVSSYVKGGKTTVQNPVNNQQQAQPEPQLQPKEHNLPQQSSNGHYNMEPEPMDFDDDIPF